MSRRSYSCDWNKKGAVEIGAFLFYYDLAKKRAFSSVVERSVHIGEVAGSIPATPTKKEILEVGNEDFLKKDTPCAYLRFLIPRRF